MSNEGKGNAGPEMQFAGVYPLRRPVEFEGQRITEVKYDLEALGAQDVIAAKSEAAQLRNGTGDSLLTDDLLHAVIFARSADLPGSVVLLLSAADYAAWSTVAQGFFATAVAGMVQ